MRVSEGDTGHSDVLEKSHLWTDFSSPVPTPLPYADTRASLAWKGFCPPTTAAHVAKTKSNGAPPSQGSGIMKASPHGPRVFQNLPLLLLLQGATVQNQANDSVAGSSP
jgi:hypothetical protein